MALPSSLTIIILFFFLYILAGHAARDLPTPITKHRNITNYNLASAGYTYVATLYPFGGQNWQGKCFKNNFGYVTYTQDFGLGYIRVQTWEPESTFCSDSYEFRVAGKTLASDTFYTRLTNPHEVVFQPDSSLKASIRQNGVAVYLYNSA